MHAAGGGHGGPKLADQGAKRELGNGYRARQDTKDTASRASTIAWQFISGGHRPPYG
jgi:hypothetical protein